MELIYCHEHGYAWDKDVSKTVSYDQEYFDKYVNYEKTKLGEVLTKFRVNYVKEYVDQVLDIGIGSGQFVKAFNHVGKAKGYDVNPVAEKWLVDEDLWLNPYQDEYLYLMI